MNRVKTSIAFAGWRVPVGFESDGCTRVHLRALGATAFMAGVYYAAKVLRPASQRPQPLPYQGWRSILRREPLAI